MANLTINGRAVTVDDSFLNLSREEQEATVEHIASSLPEDAPEPSGAVAGAAHGARELVQGPRETLKRYAGVGPGRQEEPNYVPANVTHGSFNPMNWDFSQIPQKVAELAPGVAAGSLAAKLGSKLLHSKSAKGKLLGALIGAGLYGLGSTAGDTAKEATVERTGDPNAPSSTEDLVRGGATAAVASTANALLPARLGMSKIGGGAVGVPGALAAAQRHAGTAGIGGAGAVVADATKQAGLSVGTDKGLSVDPSSFPESFVGGAATGAVMAAPKLGFDAQRAASLREHGGANLEATKNYATRLNTAGEGKLGDKLIGAGKFDQTAHDTTVNELRRETAAAAANVRKQTTLSPEADHALTRAANNERLSDKDIELIDRETAGAPDGANAAFLARSVRMSQLAAERGQNGGKAGWTGGISGVADANIGYMLNPFRMATGAAASLGGASLLGASNPMFAATAMGLYGGARLIDGAMGTRSPARTFAEHFADQAAQLRKPTTTAPQPPQGLAGASSPWGPRPPMTGPTGPVVPPPVIQRAPQGPWGPRPSPTSLVPNVAQAGPPVPNVAFNPIRLAMLKQEAKQAAKAPQPDPVPKVDFDPVRLAMLKQGMKQEAQAAKAGPQEAAPKQDPLPDVAFNPIRLAMLKQGLKEEAKAAKAAPKAEAQPDPVPKVDFDPVRLAMLKQELKQAQKPQPQPKKITKANGKVEAGDDPFANRKPFEPRSDAKLYPEGISPQEYAKLEAAKYLGDGAPPGRRENYMELAETTARDRIATIEALKRSHPKFNIAFDGLLRQLHRIGGNHERALDAVHHYAGLLSDEAGAALRNAFK